MACFNNEFGAKRITPMVNGAQPRLVGHHDVDACSGAHFSSSRVVESTGYMYLRAFAVLVCSTPSRPSSPTWSPPALQRGAIYKRVGEVR